MNLIILVTPAPAATTAMVGMLTSAAPFVSGMGNRIARTVIPWIFKYTLNF